MIGEGTPIPEILTALEWNRRFAIYFRS